MSLGARLALRSAPAGSWISRPSPSSAEPQNPRSARASALPSSQGFTCISRSRDDPTWRRPSWD